MTFRNYSIRTHMHTYVHACLSVYVKGPHYYSLPPELLFLLLTSKAPFPRFPT